ncbi:MAG: tetratricopeptide repeat protein [Methylophaga sp.]|nr:tetratricopeptide repeat protein [Methylophaga sp.]
MKLLIAFISIALLSISVAHADMTPEIIKLQQEWAKANYSIEGDEQKKAFETLIERANRVVESNPESAEALIWSGIINSTYAGVKGGLGAMKYAKASKADLEKAISLNGDALSGSAYMSLGILYFKVPGWPIGFGDDDKALELLDKALALSPEGIDSNYFYADFLVEQGKYKQAEQHLLKAQQASVRPTRPLADKGRQQEIAVLLAKVQQKSQEKEGNKPF